MGLAPILVEQIFDIIKEINAAGHDGPAGRAERPHGARRSPTAATSSRPARSSCPTRRRPSPRTRRSAPPTSAVTDPAGAMTDLRRVTGPPSPLRPARRPAHRRRRRGHPRRGRQAVGRRPAAPAAVAPPTATPTASPTARAVRWPHVFDFLTFGDERAATGLGDLAGRQPRLVRLRDADRPGAAAVEPAPEPVRRRRRSRSRRPPTSAGPGGPDVLADASASRPAATST